MKRDDRNSDRLRILHLLDHSVPQFSGYSFRSRYIMTMQGRLGLDVQVVTSARHESPGPCMELHDGIPHHRTTKPGGLLNDWQLRLPFWRERLLTAAMEHRLESVAREFAPDVLHAHSPFFNGLAALRVGKRLGIPVVYEVRAFWEDDAVDKGKFREGSFVYRQVRRLETDVARRADHLICICEGLRRDLAARDIPANRITVIKNGAEPEAFAPRPRSESLAERYGIGARRVIGFIGSFFHYEGLPELVECAARLAESRRDFVFLLVGAGEDDAEVRAMVTRKGLAGQVILTGRVAHQEIAEHYALCDALIYPRRSRRLTELVTPLKPLEAMAMERVVLGSDVGGIRELFAECGVGTLFTPGDPQALDRAVTDFLSRSQEQIGDEGRRGRLAVLERRSWIDVIRPVLDVYERLAGVPAPGAALR